MRIGTLSEKTGVSERSLRHYEQRNLITSERLPNGYRDFDSSMVDRVNKIQLYLGLGLNLEQVDTILSCLDVKPALYENPCSSIISLYEQKLDDINEQIELLSKIKFNLEEHVMILKRNQDKSFTQRGDALC
ncbi:MerR family transcriptional regulator [Ectobacillus panaciterrae]|uniref:MerR family transcriptional regulator n=1 Tax=Ectobacillus panaciterrae TaxID=363872 RepID=UPI0004216719|nr:MerR family transcriptional regulator [Ectobacillus panaciterrae]